MIEEFILSASYPLRLMAAMLTELALNAMGCGVERELTMLRLDGETSIAITDACGGIGQLGSLFVAGAVMSVLMQKGWMRRVLHWSMALPSVVIANSVRLVFTGLAWNMGCEWALGETCHIAMGWAETFLAAGLLWGAGRLIRWTGED